MELLNCMTESETSMIYDNVMLLTMSTLPFNPIMNTYIITEGGRDFIYKGISQLEPHTKHVIAKLAQFDQRLDRIVILASKKTREEYPERWNGETALSFFEKRIQKFVGMEGQLDNLAEDSLPDRVEIIVREDLYRDNPPKFLVVEMENELFFWEAVQKILGSNKKQNVVTFMI